MAGGIEWTRFFFWCQDAGRCSSEKGRDECYYICVDLTEWSWINWISPQLAATCYNVSLREKQCLVIKSSIYIYQSYRFRTRTHTLTALKTGDGVYLWDNFTPDMKNNYCIEKHMTLTCQKSLGWTVSLHWWITIYWSCFHLDWEGCMCSYLNSCDSYW